MATTQLSVSIVTEERASGVSVIHDSWGGGGGARGEGGVLKGGGGGGQVRRAGEWREGGRNMKAGWVGGGVQKEEWGSGKKNRAEGRGEEYEDWGRWGGGYEC